MRARDGPISRNRLGIILPQEDMTCSVSGSYKAAINQPRLENASIGRSASARRRTLDKFWFATVRRSREIEITMFYSHLYAVDNDAYALKMKRSHEYLDEWSLTRVISLPNYRAVVVPRSETPLIQRIQEAQQQSTKAKF
ncbi:hypothetical protein TWF694_006286 [Orbilia ellipsospora]|uniref:Uncharacterized protein n=1 Tax=Orbilia ellipsospora TaxID=2528407 RepID=A0AAV9XJR8_9PEZI